MGFPAGVRRVHVIGSGGAGKSTVARAVGAALGAAVYDLDFIGWQGGSWRRPVALARRLAHIREISRSPSWVTEGVYLGWTGELFEQADVIVWLDHLRWWQAARRIARRHARQLLATVTGSELPDAHQDDRRGAFEILADAVHIIANLRGYYLAADPSGNDDCPNRADTITELRRYGHKILHCRTSADLDRLLDGLPQLATAGHLTPESTLSAV